MRQAVRLWDRWAENDREALGELIHAYEPPGIDMISWLYEDPALSRYGPHGRDLIAPAPEMPPFDREDILAPAVAILIESVSKHLGEFTQPVMQYDAKTKRPVLRLQPRSLLGAMWLQLAQAINEHDTFRACPCGKWFRVNTALDARKARKRFCGDLCKLHDHRRRLAEALRLAAQGVKAGEIAQQTGTPIATVKNWPGQSHTKQKEK